MKNDGKRTSEGLNEWFEMINAKGDKGEIAQIVEKYKAQAGDSNDAALKTRRGISTKIDNSHQKLIFLS